MPSKNTQVKKELEQSKEQEKLKAFLLDIDEVYKKHGMQLAPVLNAQKNGIIPQLEVQYVQVQETDKTTDTDNKGLEA